MKIDTYRQSFITDAAAPTPAASDRTGVRAGTSAAPGRDQVNVSADAQLLSAALKAAPPAGVRTDLVEQMKARLAAGEIGNDPQRLADRMIDGFLEP